MTASVIQFPKSEEVERQRARDEEAHQREESMKAYEAKQRAEKQARLAERARGKGKDIVRVIGGNGFFYDRPNLFELLPSVFRVEQTGDRSSIPIGWFVADRSYMPVIPSRRVKVEV
jgi:hypothetical protein